MDALTVIEKYGIPTTILILVMIALDKRVWPFIVAQVTAWQADRTRERDAFLSALADLEAAAAAGHAAAADRDHVNAEQIEAMAKAVQQVAVLVQHNYNALHVVKPHIQKRKVEPMQ